MQLIKPIASLFRNLNRTPVSVAPTPQQYFVALSNDLRTILDEGLNRAIMDRIERPGAKVPSLIIGCGLAIYEFSQNEQTLFKYHRAEVFTIEELRAAKQVLLQSPGPLLIGTLKELDRVCAWAEHEQDYLKLNRLYFRRFKGANGDVMPKSIIDQWLGDLIVAIGFAPAYVPRRAKRWDWLGAWFPVSESKKSWSKEVGFS